MEKGELDKNFPESWDPREYLETEYRRGCSMDGYTRDCLTVLHDFLAAVEPRESSRFLEFASGPVIAYLLSAGGVFSEVYVAEYASKARDELHKWLHATNDAFDWSYAQEIVAELEGNRWTPDEIGERLRRKARRVVPCDILQDDVLVGDPAPREYDVIMTFNSISVPCHTAPTYGEAVAKLANLLTPGGRLIIGDDIGQHWWAQDGVKYAVVPLTEDSVLRAMESAGLKVQEHRIVNFGANDRFQGSSTIWAMAVKE